MFTAHFYACCRDLISVYESNHKLLITINYLLKIQCTDLIKEYFVWGRPKNIQSVFYFYEFKSS